MVNLAGAVIGINSAIVFGAQNIGFAIPINKARCDLDDLKKYGHIRRPFLGIPYLLINHLIQKRFRLPVDRGAFILREGLPGQGVPGQNVPDRPAIMPGSAAERAGLREGDIIVSLNNVAIDEKNAIEDVLEKVAIGEKVPIKILREGKEETLMLTAEERSDGQ